MNDQIKETLLAGLKLYEQSVKRMQTSKPKFASVFETELAQIRAAEIAVHNVKNT